MFFDATHAKPSHPSVRPIAEQEERESQRLWELTAKAVNERNHEVATDEKTKIEDRQREEAAARAQENAEWSPRLFRAVKPSAEETEQGEEGLEWIIDAHIDSAATPAEQTKQVLEIYPVLPGQKPGQAVNMSSNEAATAAKPASGNDLIDFSGGEAPVKPADDVEAMLKETGKPAEGSLIDL